ncbi:TetR/AcrR family transcriptional regulator [Dictyobacter arantiisoli]|uniref:TetR family transcriptional regulator n=1 Tax=Dictyobacter arantiisoli TaxID=2014874 RepID=A0A5A5TI41_9CHLR|nr:TetR/AcrR family transcriptional regulator [Dictyobacter arantiisoli]GCF11260.1 TetR family transcriptional regulator [Dictyobacter arantiisoli]
MAGETRQKILEATERLIKMRGLARVTTKEISREVGLSEGALYRHFEHKEEIIFTLVARYLPSFLHAFETHLPGTGDVEGNLTAIMLAGMEYFGELIPMSASFLADTELLVQYRQKMSQVKAGPNGGGPQHIENLLATYLGEERQLGRLQASIAPRELAILLLGACFQYTYLSQLMGNPPADREREQYVQELVQGILGSSQPS